MVRYNIDSTWSAGQRCGITAVVQHCRLAPISYDALAAGRRELWRIDECPRSTPSADTIHIPGTLLVRLRPPLSYAHRHWTKPNSVKRAGTSSGTGSNNPACHKSSATKHQMEVAVLNALPQVIRAEFYGRNAVREFNAAWFLSECLHRKIPTLDRTFSRRTTGMAVQNFQFVLGCLLPSYRCPRFRSHRAPEPAPIQRGR